MIVKTNDSSSMLDTDTIQPFPTASSTSGWNNASTTSSPPHQTDLKELAWVIPAVLAGVIIMLVIAILCFYGVRASELIVMRWCYRKYGCCNPNENEESTKLKDAFDPESYSLNDMSYHRKSVNR